jgi:uncharacterized membrane protein YfhO
VFINGNSADIVKVNRTFMGVYLEKAGESDVVFKFHPEGTLALLFFPSLVMLCSLLLLSTRRGSLKSKILFFASHPTQTL